jgi:hypothetical protein
MNYSKPEIAVLGDAALLVQGSKVPAGDGGSLEAPIGADCELED